MADAPDERETVTRLAPVPPEPRPSRLRFRRPDRRMLIVIGALIALSVAALLLIRGTAGYDYRAECQAVLERLTPALAESLYDEATPRFKQTLIVDKLLDLVDQMDKTLGDFKRIIRVESVNRSSTVAGRAARVRLHLAYEHAATDGEISFLTDERGVHRLLGFAIDIPPALANKAREVESDGERLRAPPEVIDAVETILARLREGKVAEIRGAAAPSFQTQVSEQALRELTSSHAEELGRFTGLLRVLSSAQNEGRTRARVQTLLQYEKRRTTATFDFHRREGRWELVAFKIVVPERFTPLSGAPPEEDEPAPPSR